MPIGKNSEYGTDKVRWQPFWLEFMPQADYHFS
jgi:hypothetical protein